MTLAHRVETILTEDGKLSLDQLPFRSGQTVEVIVLPTVAAQLAGDTLRGAVVHYDRPTEPVAEDDWDVLQ